MEPIPISTAELNALCEQLSQASYVYYPIATDFFHDLFITGARPSELLAYDQWEYISDDEIILHPDKGNADRYFTATDLSPSLLAAVIDQYPPYQRLSLRQLTSVLKKILPLVEIQTIDKSAITYMFRYNKVKTLKEDGNTYSEITEKFGWADEALAVSYDQRQLYRVGPLPPPATNQIIDNSGNSLIDSDGTFIVHNS